MYALFSLYVTTTVNEIITDTVRKLLEPLLQSIEFRQNVFVLEFLSLLCAEVMFPGTHKNNLSIEYGKTKFLSEISLD